ncbi:MAG TPA: hypothetical protein VEP89_10235 [Draconibacterium sp.]|nr:hypothetical protein [Draconibacterium sp.]
MKTVSKYLPVPPDFYDIAKSFLLQNVKVIYFGVDNTLEESKGKYRKLVKNSKGEFLEIENDKNVRLDRIITVNGKIGPAYDEYDAYANACLSCQAGYDE